MRGEGDWLRSISSAAITRGIGANFGDKFGVRL